MIADNAADADALATALYVMGPEAANDYCRAHPEVAGLLVCPARRRGGIEIVRLNLDDSPRASFKAA